MLLAPISADAAKRERITKASVKVPAGTPVVDLFAGMKSGKLDVSFIPKGPEGANVLIKNKTGKPVRIALPAAFAGVPVHRQFGGGMGGMGGGGMGGMGGMGGGGGGGFFNVAPDKIGKIEVVTVCLEHGRPDPTPKMQYTIMPIEKFTKNPEVIEVCKMVGSGKISQNAAQAAAWHLTDNMSWAKLAQKDRIRLRNGYTQKFFSPQELAFAIRLTQEANRRASAAKQYQPASKSNSLSNQPVGEE